MNETNELRGGVPSETWGNYVACGEFKCSFLIGR
jgi:hypothetical protein